METTQKPTATNPQTSVAANGLATGSRLNHTAFTCRLPGARYRRQPALRSTVAKQKSQIHLLPPG